MNWFYAQDILTWLGPDPNRTYLPIPELCAALGLSATHSGGIVTLTATTATTTQCVTGVGGARIVCAQAILASLNKLKLAPHFTGAAANSSWNGDVYEVPVDGYPHIYVALVNTEAAAATFEVGAALLPW